MKNKTWLWVGLSILGMVCFCCGGIFLGAVIFNQDKSLTQLNPRTPEAVTTSSPYPALPPPTVTAFPTPLPPIVAPGEPPRNGDLRDLVEYANKMQPILMEAGKLLERDGEILKSSEGGNDDVLCDGRLEADNTDMQDLLNQIKDISPPTEAKVIHELVFTSGQAWTEALDNIEQFCTTKNQLYKIPAVVKFWEAAAIIQDAGNRFWLLLVAKGVEDWVQR